MFKKTKSRTSTTQATTYRSHTSTEDNRVAADNGAIVNRNGRISVTHNTVDGGAIAMAGEAAEAGIDAGVLFGRMAEDMNRDGLNFSKEITGEAFDYSRDLTRRNMDYSKSMTDTGLDFGRDLATRSMDYGKSLADDGFDIASRSLDRLETTYRNAAERDQETLKMVMNQNHGTMSAILASERDDAAQLSEQLVNMIPYIVVGVVAWSLLK